MRSAMTAGRKKTAKSKLGSGILAPTGAYTPPPPPDAFGNTSTPSGGNQDAVRAPSPRPSPQRGEGVAPNVSTGRRLTQVETSALPLHDLFAKQASTMLKRADLDEEQKQAILIAMSCPCCGA